MKDCNNVKQSPLAGLAAYGGGSGSVIFGRKGVGGYQIERSLRFNDSDSPSLTRTFGSGNARKWTWSCWVKRNKFGGYQTLFGHVSGGSGQHYIDFGGDKIRFTRYVSSNEAALETSAVYRDPSAWYHIVAVWDTGNATANHRQRLYVNGVEVTDFSTRVNPSQNYDGVLNTAIEHNIGKVLSQNYGAFQLADMHFIDGQALAPTEFGEINDDGIWDPKRFDGSFGTNGFKLDFSTNNLGQDSSGNSNNFTVNNIEATSPAATTSNITNISTSGSNQILTFTNNTGLQYFVAGDVVGTKTTTNLFSTGAGSNLNNLIAGTSSATEYINDGNAYIQTQIWSGSATFYFSANYASGEGFPTNSGDELRQNDPSGFNFDYLTVNFADGTTQNATLSNNVWTLATNGRSVRGISTSFFTSIQSTISFDAFEIYDSGGTKRTMSIYGTGDAAVVSVAPASSQMTVEAGNFSTGTTLSKTAVVGDDSFDSPVESTGSDTGAGAEINGNYATLNTAFGTVTGSTNTPANGNLTVTGGSSANFSPTTIPVTSGKWYVEVTVAGSGNSSTVGIWKMPMTYGTNYYQNENYRYYQQDGKIYNESGATSTTYNTYAAGDVIGIALDMDNGKVYFSKNGTFQGSSVPASGTNPAASGLSGTWAIALQAGASSSHTLTLNAGQRSYSYSAPTGFKTLCTTNLSDPTIAAGANHFDVSLWTGNGNTGRNITGLSFSPDLTWIKSRSLAKAHALFDTVRGANKRLQSNSTNAETTHTDQLSAFISNGFTVEANNTVNQNNATYAGWSWDAGANSNKTYAVKVVSDSGNKYRFDDFGTSAVTLDLEEGSTYVFDQSDSSNSGHPLRFSTTSDGTHGGGSEYTTGVTVTGTPGNAGAKTTIVVAASAPTLYYYCSVHSGMGGQADTNSTAGASNFDGSVQAVVKANSTAGFSVVSWDGTSANATVGHGLNAAPEFIITKVRGMSSNWYCYHTRLTDATKYIWLNSTNAEGTQTAAWNSTDPTSSVIHVGGEAEVNRNGYNTIAYCFAPVEGYSAFGSYTGNGATDGPFVHTGFRPRFVIIKNTNLSTQNWYILDSERDSYNLTANKLEPNTTNAENASPNTATTNSLDFLSNGFKFRTSNDGTNQNNASYVYAAFAEHPFKNARAR